MLLLYSEQKNHLNFELVQTINEFYQGLDKETFVHHLISSVAVLLPIFKDLDSLDKSANLRTYFQ